MIYQKVRRKNPTFERLNHWSFRGLFIFFTFVKPFQKHIISVQSLAKIEIVYKEPL